MNNKGADQTVRMRRLICTFVVWGADQTAWMHGSSYSNGRYKWRFLFLFNIMIHFETSSNYSLTVPHLQQTAVSLQRPWFSPHTLHILSRDQGHFHPTCWRSLAGCLYAWTDYSTWKSGSSPDGLLVVLNCKVWWKKKIDTQQDKG